MIQSQYNLKYLESKALECVLSDAVTQMTILANCDNDIRAMKLDLSSLEKQRFNIKAEKFVDPKATEEADAKQLNSMHNRIYKWDDDRRKVCELLERVFREVADSGSFGGLVRRLDDWSQEDETQRRIVEEEANLTEELHKLEQKLAKENHISELAIRERDIEHKLLIDAIDDIELNNQMIYRYVSKWESSRTAQLQLKLTIRETTLEDKTKQFATKMEQEVKISGDIEKCILQGISDYEKKIIFWIEKYAEDSERLDKEIKAMKDTTNRLRREFGGLVSKFDTRKAEMEAWMEFVAERNARLEREDKMNRNATRIQAWWRGIVVRRLLKAGAVKKDKKGKGKKR